MYTSDDVTFYVPCYNANKTIDACLGSISQQTQRPAEILLIDDGSTDAPEYSADQTVRVISHSTNRGLAAARNTAIEHCTTRLIASIDADVVIEPNWLNVLLGVLNSKLYIGAGGALHEQFNRRLADRWRATHMAQHWGDHEQINPRFLYGANTIFAVEALRSVGGYDARLRTNDEDRTMCERLYEEGHQLFYTPTAKSKHLRQDSIDTILPGYWRWHYSKGLLQGDFSSLQGMLKRMELVNFGIFQYRLALDKDAGRDDFVVIDSLIPWVFSALDLSFFTQQTGIMVPHFPNLDLEKLLPPGVARLLPSGQIQSSDIQEAGFEFANCYVDLFKCLLSESGWNELKKSIGGDWDLLLK